MSSALSITRAVNPPRAAYLRMILAELQRLASHLVWLATHAVDIGAITPFFYTFRERDAILDLFEEYCGARLTLNCMKIGGLPFGRRFQSQHQPDSG